MKRTRTFQKGRSAVSLCMAVLMLSLPISVMADWTKVDPPPDVDKSFHHPGTPPPTCWLATAANMLAAAGYGQGKTMQERADDIYTDLTAHYGTGSGGWTDTAISWWLSSANNTQPGNPYKTVTVYGNKSPRYPWSNANGARFIGNELRRCQFVGLSISWPTCGSSIGTGGHAITCWGDSGGAGTLTGNPSQVIVTDSDRDTGGDVQKYTYDNYTNPNPSGCDEGNGWYFNYNANHPYIKHIITFCPTDNPTDTTLTQKVIGSYRIHQSSRISATDLHYKVGTDTNILTYKTSINYTADGPPEIEENADPPSELTVDWYFKERPVPYCTWITITTEFVLPYWNGIYYRDVYFTYPDLILPFPWFRWYMETPVLDLPKPIPNITGGYVIGAFDLVSTEASQQQQGPAVIGEYRFVHEYDYLQDPEHHFFELMGHPEQAYQGYYATNLRFGHAYGLLEGEELWCFQNWLTRKPDFYPLDIGEPIMVELDWDGQLPYPEGEIYQGEYKPPECTEFLPQDFNKDCCVDFYDLAIFAEAWLRCTYPLFQVGN